MAWTDEMVVDLRKMWADGLTTGEIAKRLGVSKNAIVGKVHRLGLSGRPSPIKKKIVVEEQAPTLKEANDNKEIKEIKATKKEKTNVSKVVEEALVIKKEEVIKEPIKETKKYVNTTKETMTSEKEAEPTKHKEGVVKLVDLDAHTCRWPIGDPKDEKFHFCGKKVRIGHTYCDEHSEIAYVKQTKK